MQHREHVERRGVAVRILAVREQARLLMFLAACQKREEIEQRIGGDSNETSLCSASRNVLPRTSVM